MGRLQNTLTALFILFLPFQDLGLRNSALGIAGASLAAFPLACLAVVAFYVWLSSEKRRVSKSFLACATYLLLLNTLSLIRFGPTTLGINVASKSLNLAVITWLLVFCICGVDYLALKNFPRFVHTAFFIALAGIAISDLDFLGLGGLANNALLHGTVNLDLRWRSFASEASLFSVLIVNLGLVAAQYSKQKLTKWAFAFVAVLVLFVSASKGGILTLLISCTLMALAGGLRWKTWCKSIIVAIPLFAFGFSRLGAAASDNLLQETTTAATRSVMAVWGLRSVLENPWGLGFGGFYGALAHSLPAAINTIFQISPMPLNFSEVEQYTASAENATSKIFVLNYALFCGLPVLCLFIFRLWRQLRLLSIKRHFFLIAAVIYTALALCSYVDMPTAYSAFFVFGVALCEARRTIALSRVISGLVHATSQSQDSPAHQRTISLRCI